MAWDTRGEAEEYGNHQGEVEDFIRAGHEVWLLLGAGDERHPETDEVGRPVNVASGRLRNEIKDVVAYTSKDPDNLQKPWPQSVVGNRSLNQGGGSTTTRSSSTGTTWRKLANSPMSIPSAPPGKTPGNPPEMALPLLGRRRCCPASSMAPIHV